MAIRALRTAGCLIHFAAKRMTVLRQPNPTQFEELQKNACKTSWQKRADRPAATRGWVGSMWCA